MAEMKQGLSPQVKKSTAESEKFSDEFQRMIGSDEVLRALLEGSRVTYPEWNRSAAWKAWEDGRRFIAATIDSDGSILDYGCANGFLLRSLQEWSPYRHDVYGEDNDEEVIAAAKKLFPDQSNHFLTPDDVVSGRNFPESFDFIYCNVWEGYKFGSDDLLKELFNRANKRLILGFYDPVQPNNLKRIKELEAFGFVASGVMENPNGSNEVIAWFDKIQRQLHDRAPITSETKKWEPNLDTISPIEIAEIPNFKSWVNWNGFRINPEGRRMWHPGYDFAAYLDTNGTIILGLPKNTKIRAVADGRVLNIAGIGGEYGRYITLEHGRNSSGLFSRYVHCTPLVEFGSKVKKGDIIGELWKDPGDEEGRLVHLHFELLDSPPTNPAASIHRDPNLLFGDLYTLNAAPQGNPTFAVAELIEAPVETMHFKKLKVDVV